jgi:hypothetical protein
MRVVFDEDGIGMIMAHLPQEFIKGPHQRHSLARRVGAGSVRQDKVILHVNNIKKGFGRRDVAHGLLRISSQKGWKVSRLLPQFREGIWQRMNYMAQTGQAQQKE